MTSGRIQIACLLLFFSSLLTAQTPIANRVNVAAEHLPDDASVLAKYTDNERHCLYYIRNNKVFCLDVVLNIDEELDFTSHGYNKILSWHISPGGEYMFICIDKGNKNNRTLEEQFELWRIHSGNKSFKRIGSAFSIDKTKNGFILRKTARCLNPHAPKAQQRWRVRDHHFDMTGKHTGTQPEYEYRMN